MSDHDPPRRWVEVGADAICDHVRSRRSPRDEKGHLLYCLVCERTAMTALRAVLPLVDSLASSGIRAERQVLAELRADVEALRTENSGDAKSGNRLDRDFNLGKVFAYERVLDLIDGSSDE